MKSCLLKYKKGGFTLLEVLVALSLLGIAMAVVFQLFSANLRGIAVSEEYSCASAKAMSKMKEILASDKIEEKVWQGAAEDGYRFNVHVSKTLQERTEKLQVELLQIDLTVSWTKGIKDRSLTMRTMKVVNKKV